MPSAEDLAVKVSIPEPPHVFKKGDRVQWMECRQRGSSLNFTARHGEVLDITEMTALVRDDRSRRKKMLNPKKLRPERSLVGPVTELLFAMAGQPLPNICANQNQIPVPRGTNPRLPGEGSEIPNPKSL
jgi:hypothetical protein